MQVLNDLGMTILYFARGGGLHWMLGLFTTGVELGSTVIAVLVAIVLVRMEISVFVLLLAILAAGMMFLKSFAEMRFRLEALVDYRTRQLRLKSRELQQQATHDTLTGLFNRRYADDYLQQQLSYSRRHNTDFALALADVDNFKQINDSHSHAVGDEVLRRIADLLTQRCRNSDMISRFGGEEFLICFPSTNKNKAEEICSELRAAVESTDWSSIAENLQVTISFGVAETDASSRSTTILNTADARLYKAKGEGRNRVVA
jgi:diguanylate cyclase (GGDEF)-like protein